MEHFSSLSVLFSGNMHQFALFFGKLFQKVLSDDKKRSELQFAPLNQLIRAAGEFRNLRFYLGCLPVPQSDGTPQSRAGYTAIR